MLHQNEFFSSPVIAHRGFSVRAPENTLEAFTAAKSVGALWVEADIKLTSDGIPILMHDDTLDRTTSGTGPISQKTYSEIKALDAGSWFNEKYSSCRVPTLVDFLALCLRTQLRPIIELKPSPERTQATVMVSLIEAAKIWPENVPPPVISSFNRDALMIAAQLNPDWPRCVLFSEWPDDCAKAAALTQASIIALEDTTLTTEHLNLLAQTPLPTLAYTINNPLREKELINKGIQAVFSDDIEGLLKK